MHGARLDDKNFVEQMCRFGFFAEQMPPCFSSESLARYSKELAALVGKSRLTYPASLSIYKTQTSRRIISVANPYAFLCATKYMHERRKKILSLTQSENSESPITFIQSYNLGGEEIERVTINSEAARTTLHARSDYAENLRGRVSLAMGCRYRLSIDIASCYDTIYTHSLSWAVCGKRDAKRMFSSQNKVLQTADYQFANELDKRMRDQKGQETNGILTGPYTSRIFSEIILCGIDKILRDEGYVFRRYVDDYKFYFRTEADARRAIIGVSKILAEFNLSVNQSKLSIEEYPFDLQPAMRRRLDEALRASGVFGALNEAGILFAEGEKGSYKYALKMLGGKEMPERDREVVLSILFNINLIDPRYARFLVGYLVQSREGVGVERLGAIVNDELSRSIEEGYEQEILNLLYFIRKLDLQARGELLLKSSHAPRRGAQTRMKIPWPPCDNGEGWVVPNRARGYE